MAGRVAHRLAGVSKKEQGRCSKRDSSDSGVLGQVEGGVMTRTGHGLEPLPDGGIRPVVPRNEPPSSRTSPHSTARSGI